MIDEDDLRALFNEAAESVPPPGSAPQALLDAIAEQSKPTPRRRPSRRLTVLAAAAGLMVIAIVGSQLLDREATRTFNASGAPIDEASGGGNAASTTTTPGAFRNQGGAAGGTTSDGANVVQDGVAVAPQPLSPAEPAAPSDATSGGTDAVGQPTDTAKVIRTGSLDLEVRKGAFQSTVDRITAQTIALGGYVAESTTSESGESPSGSIKVRVPGDSFDQLVVDLRKLGDVKAVTSKGTDVTAQYTDLKARETALVATRDRLSTVLSAATKVADILAVQDRITVVQTEIEQVQGQQKLLDDQTAYGTLAVTLGEPGAEIIKVEEQGDGGIGSAWDDARRRFGDNFETIVSWSGSAAAALIVGLALLVVARFAWVGMRRRLV